MVLPDNDSAEFAREIEAGERFAFGRNWAQFLRSLNDERIAAAESSLSDMLGRSVRGLRFIDIGSGSGLFSLAAMRLGAQRVHSIDYDPDSIACTKVLRTRYFSSDPRWTVERASALDASYLASLGEWDVVYSWGVLHHTGSMWAGLENAVRTVAPGGSLFVSIYNDQGLVSKGWSAVKRMYNRHSIGKAVVCVAFVPYFAITGAIADLGRRRNPITRYRSPAGVRGMSIVRDWFDWLGGYPFEVAKPGELVEFGRRRGLELVKMRTCGRKMGCNEFVFRRGDETPLETD